MTTVHALKIPVATSAVTYYIPVVKKCKVVKAVIAASGTLDATETMTITDGTTTSHTFTIPASCTAGTQVTAAETNDVVYDITDNFVVTTNANNTGGACTAYLILDLDVFSRT